MDTLSRKRTGQKSEGPLPSEIATSLDSDVYTSGAGGQAAVSRWRKVAAVAGASAILGGLAVAWWYRGTLLKLRQAAESDPSSHFGTSRVDPTEDD